MTRFIKRGGKVWIRCFRTAGHQEAGRDAHGPRQGKRRGVHAVVKMGRILYEMEGVTEEIARKANVARLAQAAPATKLVRRSASWERKP